MKRVQCGNYALIIFTLPLLDHSAVAKFLQGISLAMAATAVMSMQCFLGFLVFPLCLAVTLLVILLIRFWQSKDHVMTAFATYRERYEDSGVQAMRRPGRQLCPSCHEVVEADARSLAK
ncbi:MAG TPA: hypothetical protein V6D22_13990 [Candidatus Obscuribacterales bacterium]